MVEAIEKLSEGIMYIPLRTLLPPNWEIEYGEFNNYKDGDFGERGGMDVKDYENHQIKLDLVEEFKKNIPRVVYLFLTKDQDGEEYECKSVKVQNYSKGVEDLEVRYFLRKSCDKFTFSYEFAAANLQHKDITEWEPYW